MPRPAGGADGAAVWGARLGRLVVPARLRLLRRPVGSAANEEGQIYIEPQGICVMAGIGVDDGRARRALDSRRRAARDAARHRPAAARVSARMTWSSARSRSYPPGYKENGSVFCHTNPWIMIAEAMAGDGERGVRLLPAHQPVGARGDQRPPPVRAVRVRADDRRAGGAARTARRRTHGSPARPRGASSRSPSGSSASGRSTTASASTRACRRLERVHRARRFRGATYEITVRKEPGVRAGSDASWSTVVPSRETSYTGAARRGRGRRGGRGVASAHG